jgi:hypothetical protein
VSPEFEWAMVEHPEWFGAEERDEEMEEGDQEMLEEEVIDMTEEEAVEQWQMMRAEMCEQPLLRQEVLEDSIRRCRLREPATHIYILIE